MWGSYELLLKSKITIPCYLRTHRSDYEKYFKNNEEKQETLLSERRSAVCPIISSLCISALNKWGCNCASASSMSLPLSYTLVIESVRHIEKPRPPNVYNLSYVPSGSFPFSVVTFNLPMCNEISLWMDGYH